MSQTTQQALVPEVTATLYRGRLIEFVESPRTPELRVDGVRVAVTRLGPGRFYSWSLPHCSFSTIEDLARAFVHRYFGASNILNEPTEIYGRFELPDG